MPDERLIQDGGFNQLLQRRLNTAAAPSVAVAPEVFPIFPAGQYTSDLDRLLGIRRCAAYAAFAGGAGVPSQWWLANPVGSNVIAVFTDIQFLPGSGDGIISLYPGSLATGNLGATATVPLDTRFGLPTQTTLSTIFANAANNAAALAAERAFAYFTAGMVYRLTDPGIVVSPGFTLVVRSVTNNVALYANARWIERRAQPSEL